MGGDGERKMIGRGFIKVMGTNFVSPWRIRPKIYSKEIG
jgi:hypothetical protein